LLSPNIEPTPLTPFDGLELARANLFQETHYFLCAPPEAPPAAVKRVSDMAHLLQARPFFMDPVEHDGMRAAVEGLPLLSSLALMKEVSDAPGWQDTRRMADHLFAMTTAPLVREAEVQRALVLLNATQLLPRLDTLIRELMQLREWITQQDAAALEEAFERATIARARWLTERDQSDWQEELSEHGVTGTFGSLKSVFGFGSRQPKPKED
jgi:prephenate dehydrogenase